MASSSLGCGFTLLLSGSGVKILCFSIFAFTVLDLELHGSKKPAKTNIHLEEELKIEAASVIFIYIFHYCNLHIYIYRVIVLSKEGVCVNN
uniref:Uncharacterized protein n=1 Tax=Manihot esculenta TaxID=3983 RepID=A0A2C9W5Y8_MANES